MIIRGSGRKVTCPILYLHAKLMATETGWPCVIASELIRNNCFGFRDRESVVVGYCGRIMGGACFKLESVCYSGRINQWFRFSLNL